MTQAKSLRELLLIREENLDYLETINKNLGTALGLKNGDGDPCIIVFVPRKINAKWLSSGTLIKERLETATGLWCPVDVVEGGKREEFLEPHFVDVSDSLTAFTGTAPTYTPFDIIGPPPLSSTGRVRLLESLKGWSEKISPGSQLYHPRGWWGTLGCFVVDAAGKVGVLTNKHVAGEVNDVLKFPDSIGLPLAVVAKTFEYLADEVRFPGVVDRPEDDYRVDCAFAPLHPDRTLSDVEPRVPTLDATDRTQFQVLGDPLRLDIDTMGPIGEEVFAVGRTRSFQRGTIGAFAYSWDDPQYDFQKSRKFTDYLIVGEDGEEFSGPGDSGKLVVTVKGNQPVALLWGGWRERLRSGRMQEDWTYAIDINTILELLDVRILKELPTAPPPAQFGGPQSLCSRRTRLR